MAASAAPAGERRRYFRFIVAGAANTALSIAVYQLALFAFDYTVSYCVAYAAGIAFAYYAYARHVFDAKMSAGRLALFTGFYLASGAAGALLNAAFVERAGLAPRLAILATIAVMLPVNYLGSKWCLRGELRPRAAREGADAC
jgi:putative flippase GtrA